MKMVKIFMKGKMVGLTTKVTVPGRPRSQASAFHYPKPAPALGFGRPPPLSTPLPSRAAGIDDGADLALQSPARVCADAAVCLMASSVIIGHGIGTFRLIRIAVRKAGDIMMVI